MSPKYVSAVWDSVCGESARANDDCTSSACRALPSANFSDGRKSNMKTPPSPSTSQPAARSATTLSSESSLTSPAKSSTAYREDPVSRTSAGSRVTGRDPAMRKTWAGAGFSRGAAISPAAAKLPPCA